MNLSSYLTKRPNSQYWQIRWMVPLASRSLVGKAEFTKSLRVTDRKEAERLAYPILAEWKARIDAAMGSPASSSDYRPTQDELEELAITVGYERGNAKVADVIKNGAILGVEAHERLRGTLERARKQYVRDLQAGDLARCEEIARKELAKRRWIVAESTTDFANFVRAIAQFNIDALGIGLAKMDGAEQAYLPSVLAQKVTSRIAVQAKPGQGIMELFEQYAAQRSREKLKRADTIDQDRKVIRQFAAFVGENRSLRSIEPSEVRDWRNVVAALPPNYRKMKAYRGLSIREASKLPLPAGQEPISYNTVNKYLSTLSPLFAWCQTEGHADRNPCDGLFFYVAKGSNPRPPFTVDQLNRILRSPLFAGFAEDGREHEPGDRKADDWRYWIPLICLFTGARIGEIAQLHIADIKQEHGVWFFHIRNDEETGQSTKSGFSRAAPVHSTLQKLGFLSFVTRQRATSDKSGNPQLFPELEPNERGQISGKPSRFWRGYLSSIGVKKGRDGYGAHSFRHTMADQLRLGHYLDDQIEVALGHNQKTVTSGYGKLKQGTVKMLSEMLESAKFIGVDFSHLVTNT